MQNLSIPIQYRAHQYTQPSKKQVRFGIEQGDPPPPPYRNVTLTREQAQVIARSMVNMADRLLTAMHDRGDFHEDAAEALEGAIHLYEMAYDTLNPDLARAHKQLGIIRLKQGNAKEAEKHLKEAKRILEANSSNHPDLPGVLKGLIRVYKQTGRHQEAELLQTQADKIQGTSPWHDKIH